MDIVLNVNDLHTPIKRQKDWIQSKTLIHVLSKKKKPILNKI